MDLEDTKHKCAGEWVERGWTAAVTTDAAKWNGESGGHRSGLRSTTGPAKLYVAV